jgi:voltage-gated potassium channel
VKSLNLQKSKIVNMAVVVLTIASIIIVFVTYLYPLSENQIWTLYIFDLFVTAMLAVDFYSRIKKSDNRLKYVIAHWYEFPALIPLIVFGYADMSPVIQQTIRTTRFIALFRLIRLYNLALMVKGNEIILLSSLAVVTIIFGGFGFYFSEVQSLDRHANVKNLNDAIWLALETMTTVAYGEFYPVTPIGRMISAVLQFSAIGIIWTVIALITSKFVEKKIKPTKVGIVEETKSLIKGKIDDIEKLNKTELESLIRMIRSLNKV